MRNYILALIITVTFFGCSDSKKSKRDPGSTETQTGSLVGALLSDTELTPEDKKIWVNFCYLMKSKKDDYYEQHKSKKFNFKMSHTTCDQDYEENSNVGEISFTNENELKWKFKNSEFLSDELITFNQPILRQFCQNVFDGKDFDKVVQFSDQTVQVRLNQKSNTYELIFNHFFKNGTEEVEVIHMTTETGAMSESMPKGIDIERTYEAKCPNGQVEKKQQAIL